MTKAVLLCFIAYSVVNQLINFHKAMQDGTLPSDLLNNLTKGGTPIKLDFVTTAGFTFPPVIFGHIHMAKTAGSEINGELAQRFERVCGHKGYSYDAIAFNQRVGKVMKKADDWHWSQTLKTKDLISKSYRKYNRGRVHSTVMDEIGYHDCDWISFERQASAWHTVAKTAEWPLELHLPCRDPIDHLLSQCNMKTRNFNCTGTSLTEEVNACMLFADRFSDSLNLHANVTLKCFNPIPIEPYLNYIGQFLQPRRVRGQYVHSEFNRPRNKTAECIWNSPEKVKQEVIKIMMKMPYYRFCDRCIGSKDDLLAVKAGLRLAQV
ncbi:hypothetical protein ACHAW5_000693 [Stephanodiscus triporus]|uniref:Uncharacterized protein n=1 Tax=Stephanodiscus triporus TaxID=2934178 RepID=A0ABD3P2R9_9STRA